MQKYIFFLILSALFTQSINASSIAPLDAKEEQQVREALEVINLPKPLLGIIAAYAYLKKICTLEKLGLISALACSSDGKQGAISLGCEEKIHICNLKTGSMFPILTHNSCSFNSISFDPSGEYIVATDGQDVNILDIKTKSLTRTLSSRDAYRAIYSPDGQQILIAFRRRYLSIFDNITGSLLRVLKKHNSPIKSISYSPNNQYVAAGAADGTTVLLDPKTWSSLGICSDGTWDPITTIAFNPESTQFITGNSRGKALVWDLKMGMRVLGQPLNVFKQIHVLQDHNKKGINTVLFGEEIITAGKNNLIHFWNPKTGLKVDTMRGSAVAMSQDSATLITASDRSVHILKPFAFN